jgi:hypothetical protein
MKDEKERAVVAGTLRRAVRGASFEFAVHVWNGLHVAAGYGSEVSVVAWSCERYHGALLLTKPNIFSR